MAARGANGTNVLGTIVRNRPLYEVWRPLARYLNSDSCLDAADREVAILRTGWRTGSDYEWGNHVLVARRVGLSDDTIAALRRVKPDDPLTPWQQTLVTAVDELCQSSSLSGRTWNSLADGYSDAQMIEFVMLIGQYVMVAFVLNSIGVEREDGVPGFGEPADDDGRPAR